jgi:exodeoxyribonuclease VII large subunit
MSPADDERRDVYTVSRLNSEIRAVLEGSFPLLWVAGEISNLATPRSGHLYFSLKDDHAQVRCALFRNRRLLLRFEPDNGDQVVARVRVGLYEPRGEFQLIVEHLEPAGAGAAQRAFEQLKAKLQAEGLFDAARKRDLPAFPRRLGVITSPSGAAIRDVLKVLRRRSPHLPVLVFPAQVQGAAAAGELRAALDLAVRRRDCDVLLLTRGGGSVEDLAAFNDERLARAIAASPIPVVSAVGHEIDFTISDLVADRRAPTPSAAAELIGPDSEALALRLDRLAQAARRTTQRRQEQARQRLAVVGARLQRVAPLNRLRQQQQMLDTLDLRLGRALRRQLAARSERVGALHRRLAGQSPRQRLGFAGQRLGALPERLRQAWGNAARQRAQRLQALSRQLQAVSPLATLQRGYAVMRRPDTGEVVGGVDGVEQGDSLRALLADGELDVRVQAVHAKPPLASG